MANVKLKWWKEYIWQTVSHQQQRITHLTSAHSSLTLYKLISFWLLSFAFISWWHCRFEARLCIQTDESDAALIGNTLAVFHHSVQTALASSPGNSIINKNESADLQSCYTLHLSDNKECCPGRRGSLLFLQAGLKEEIFSSSVVHMSNVAAVVTQPGRLFHTNERSSPHLDAKLCGLIRLTV